MRVHLAQILVVTASYPWEHRINTLITCFPKELMSNVFFEHSQNVSKNIHKKRNIGFRAVDLKIVFKLKFSS